MLDHLFALAERLVPRLTSAAVVFVLAYLTDPASVGIYSATMLAYTLVQATAETAIRQVLPSVVGSPQFLRGYVIFAGSVLFVVLLTTSLLVALLAAPGLQIAAYALCVVAVAPLFNALSLRSVGLLQLAGRWSVLARNQMAAAAAAGIIGGVVMLTVSPLLGAAVFLPVVELVSAFLARASARSLVPPESQRAAPSFYELIGVAGYSGAGWLQGQADRVLLTVFAGVAALGSLSVASSIARAIADPMAASTSNLLRVRLTRGDAEVSRETAAAVRQAFLIAAGTSLLIIGASETVARSLLRADWDKALDIVPVLSIVVFFSILNSSYGMLQVFYRNLRRAVIVPTLALAAAPAVALIASVDLYWAAWLIVLREAMISVAARFTLGSRIDSASLLLGVSYAGGFAVVAAVLRIWLG